MKILALDLASTTGWAITPDESGIWNIAPRRGDSPGMRYVNLRSRLNLVLAAHPDLGLVVFEHAHHRGGAATQYALGCMATVETWCADNRIQHTGVHSATLKKHAVGKGNADKKLVVAEAQRRWPWVELRSDDHADALWLLDYADAVLLGAVR